MKVHLFILNSFSTFQQSLTEWNTLTASWALVSSVTVTEWDLVKLVTFVETEAQKLSGQIDNKSALLQKKTNAALSAFFFHTFFPPAFPVSMVSDDAFRLLQTPPDAPTPQDPIPPLTGTAGRWWRSDIHILEVQGCFSSSLAWHQVMPGFFITLYIQAYTHTQTYLYTHMERSCLHVKNLPWLETFEGSCHFFTLTSSHP